MKKLVITILLILPIFMLLVISVAGRIYSDKHYVRVESVALYEQNDNEIPDKSLIVMPSNHSKQVKVKILPVLANNKNYSFASSDEEICKAVTDENGIFLKTFEKYGTATVILTTEDSAKTVILYVKVADNVVKSVELNETEISIGLGEERILYATVHAETAENKRVRWSVPAEYADIVAVDANGTVKGLKAGEGEVVVTTVQGGLEARCKVIVEDRSAPLFFKKLTGEAVGDDIYVIDFATLDLKSCLAINADGVTMEDVKFRIDSGAQNATIENGLLTFTKANKPIVVTAYVGESDKPLHSAVMTVMALKLS